ncbi:hypothetical protein [Nocardia caishijiensis]|uniref:DUF2612 domain-containing protein n=1 Tax=Nocardia caishijiensis TaxID=184756 RepID=A0ABQ6YFG7_9NOCA|nr:hypothetical protein [Nocardia caishijiensis]KAF0836706.1 hypothetical protein FNL39_11221 [Nocardia caishijiensis]
MGTWTDQFVAPYETYLPTAADFAELAASMIHDQVACAPWTLVAGELSANALLPWVGILGGIRWSVRDGELAVGGERVTGRMEWGENELPPWGQASESGRVLAIGSDAAEIAPALADSPYGREDIALVFDQLDFANPEVLNHFWSADNRMQLTCFALARPQHRPLSADSLADPDDAPTHAVQTFVSVGFKSGYLHPCPAITAAVARALGPGLVVGQTTG